AGDPEGPRQGRPRADLGFRPGREPAAFRPHVPHRARDEVKLIEWDLAKLKYYWFTKPYVDLGPILVMLNRGSLSGSSLHNFSDKESGARVPRMYLAGRYSDIIDYVTRERNAAVDLLREGRNVLGAMGDQRRRTPSLPEQAPGP